MHGIKNMETHEVSPFRLFTPPDSTWKELVNQRTQEVFQLIYHAIKNRDTETLNNIKKAYIRANISEKFATYNPIDVYWNGNTIPSLLGSEQDEESIKFLKNYLQKNTESLFLIEKDIDVQIKTGACAREGFKSFDEYLDTTLWILYFSGIQVTQYPLLDLVVGKCCEFIDYIDLYQYSEYPHKKTLYAYTHASLGNSEQVDFFLKNLNETSRTMHLENIGYFFAKSGHCKAVISLTQNYKTNMSGAFKGYLQNGYLNESIRYLNLQQYELWQFMLVMHNQNNIEYGNLHHAPIMFPLIAATQQSIVRNLVFFRNQKKTSTFETQLLCQADKVSKRLQIYHLDFKTSLISLEMTMIFYWILELPHWFPKGRFILDVFIKILSELTENTLTHNQLKNLFLNSFFVFNRNFLTTDLEKYLEPWFDRDRYHRARAKSLLNACNEVGTALQLGKLVSRQLGLFAGSISSNQHRENTHERSLNDTTQDAYFNIMKKYERRLGFL